jgi:6-phosphofructokinase 1
MFELSIVPHDLRQLTQAQLDVRQLGPARVPSPLTSGDAQQHFGSDLTRVLASAVVGEAPGLSFEKAGPRRELYFDPAQARVGIVTCGGLCPGTNSVIRSAVLQLHHAYKVKGVLGFRFGFEGLSATHGAPPISLTPELVSNIHQSGGSVLGFGRGSQSASAMLQRLRELEVAALIVIGGDGTLRGAHAIADEAARVGYSMSVVGVPKTVDNDIPFVDRAFGFDTAVERAVEALKAAHVEATSARRGVGVVKLMGREAGFICAQATLASLDVNYCLIPEVPFELEGEHGLLASLEARLSRREHALIAVAEGCGLTLEHAQAERDASGNLRFGSGALDIGPPLCEHIKHYFARKQAPVTLKYIDPSYMIRSVPANASDNRYCELLASHAVHAALAGKTDLVIGHLNGSFVHVPLALVSAHKRRVAEDGELWSSVTSTTGQPALKVAQAGETP